VIGLAKCNSSESWRGAHFGRLITTRYICNLIVALAAIDAYNAENRDECLTRTDSFPMKPLREADLVDVSPREQREMMDIYAKLRDAEAKLIGPDGKSEILPNNLYSFLLRLLADLKAGHSVTILQSSHELTTVEASKILGMSRQYLIRLLEKEEVPYHMVGTHRRLYVRDVLAYKTKRDLARREILNDLARQEFSKGDYDKVPDDFHAGE
jgi:excisionase family DNA binding protein